MNVSDILTKLSLILIYSNRWHRCNRDILTGSLKTFFTKKIQNIGVSTCTFKFCTYTKYLKGNDELIKDGFIVILHKLTFGDTI